MYRFKFKGTVALLIIAVAAISSVLTIGYKHTVAINTLNSADTLINSNPKLALKLIREMNVPPFIGSANRARYSLLHTKVLDKNYIDVSTDSIINYAVNYYSKKGTAVQKAEMYYYRGILYLNMDNKAKTIECMVNAKGFAKDGENEYLKALISNTLGNIYYKEGSFKNAIEEFKGCVSYLPEDRYKINRADCYSYIGKCYNLLYNNDLAIEYYEMSRELYLEVENIGKASLLSSAISAIYLEIGNADNAGNLLHMWYREYGDGKIPEKDYAFWARIYLAKGDYINAKRYATMSFNLNNLTLRERAGAFTLLKEVELYNKNYKAVINCYDEYNKIIYKNYDNEKRAFVDSTIDKYNKQRQQDAYNELQLKSTYQRKVSYLIILFIIIVFATIFYYHFKKSKAQKKQLEDELNESVLTAQEMQEELASIKEQYNIVLEELEESGENSGEDAHLLNAFEFRMIQLMELMDVAYVSDNNPSKFYEKFKSYMEVTKNSNNNFSDIRYLVNKKYNGIIDYVVECHPALSDQEIDLFSMLCFGFSSNVIRLIYAHTNLTSIFTKRKRLRLKLELNENIKIETYIEKLKEQLQ